MARKPENAFIASVHRHLPATLHWEKMHNPYRSGTADVWYSGQKADLWVEYKYIDKIPSRASKIEVDLSPLQLDWLTKRKEEGRNVAVILGCPNGGAVLHVSEWKSRQVKVADFKERLVSRKDLATTILLQIGGFDDDQVGSRHLQNPGRPPKDSRARA